MKIIRYINGQKAEETDKPVKKVKLNEFVSINEMNKLLDEAEEKIKNAPKS